ncbi:CDK2-associated and cullin domain-containing protein 1-like isoform X2 [Dendronephthya gigantea]|nr:CDK2-associated and cullin domain-containing protein 1-like isoform X2 [Dendronephthya gigantea]
MYLNRFAYIMSQYLQSVEGIAAIFNYMNRFYVKPKKNSELKAELLTLFSASIADNEKLFDILNHSAAQPFSSDPKILMSIVQGLYMLKPEFAEKNRDLFSRFIPNLVGHASSLDQEIQETKALQETLRNKEEFLRDFREESGLKRSIDVAEISMDGPVKKYEPMT